MKQCGGMLNSDQIFHDSLDGTIPDGSEVQGLQRLCESDPESESDTDELTCDQVMTRTPMKRWGQPVDLAGAVLFLASSASDYVTGSSIVVDGGLLGN